MNSPDIIFPKLGIEIQTVNRVAFEVFGVSIYWYAIIIVTGVVMGLLLARIRAKRIGQDPDIYSDFLTYALILAIIGARSYYVIFAWDEYKDNLLQIFNMRNGGLAIYGGVIGAVIALIIYTKHKKLSFFQMADIAVPGLALGQAIGRWGNFMNMEAFGGPSNGMFSMALKATKARIPESMLQYVGILNGYEGSYLVVQPTFLYESLWNIGVVIILCLYSKYKKFDGEIFAGYLLLYGIGRAIIEGLRTDQLIIGTTGIPISQLLAGILVIISSIFIVYKRIKIEKNI